MQYFVKIEFSQWMTVSEAANWLAFGFYPKPQYVDEMDDGQTDARTDLVAVLDLEFSPLQKPPKISEELLKYLCPEIEARDYFEPLDVCEGRSPEEIREVIDSIKWDLRSLRENFREKHNRSVTAEELTLHLQMELEAAKNFELVSSPIRKRLERAEIDVFQALADKKIAGYGFFYENDWVDNSDPESQVPIRAEDWQYSEIDWRRNILTTTKGQYFGVCFETEHFLKLFPRPKLDPIAVSGHFHGEVFIVDQGEASIGQTPRTRERMGARSGIERHLIDTLVNAFRDLQANEKLPNKKEARVALLQDIAMTQMKFEMPRTNAQRYLVIVESRLPISPAQKSGR